MSDEQQAINETEPESTSIEQEIAEIKTNDAELEVQNEYIPPADNPEEPPVDEAQGNEIWSLHIKTQDVQQMKSLWLQTQQL